MPDSEDSQNLPGKRWPVVFALVLTLFIASILLFLEVPKAEVELDLMVSEVSFAVPERQVLSDVTPLAGLGAAGLQEMLLPRSRLLGKEAGEGIRLPAQILKAADASGARVHFAPAAEGDNAASVTLQTLALPEGTQVRMVVGAAPGRYRMSLQGEGLEIKVSLSGAVRIDLSGQAGPGKHPDIPAHPLSQLRDFGRSRQVILRPGSSQLDLDFTLKPQETGRFLPLVAASQLSFSRIDEYLDADSTIVRRLSTVLSGTLYLESLNGRQRTLRPGEQLRFERSSGLIRSLELGADHIALKFQGSVAGMRSGPESAPRSLMPSCLEWLRERQGLVLLWGTALYFFGLFQAVRYWWGTGE